ncbi:tetratricopeptide repeat protein [candidate division KSB1 bacterium]|nr:tetratricopeptide repeat protein [candidate division KSB1 bacterium]
MIQHLCLRTACCYALLVLLFATSPLLSDVTNKQQAKNPKQEEESLRVLVQEFKKVEKATTCATGAVKAFADSSFLPELLFNLSEWELRKAKLQFNLDLEKYDRKLQLFEKDSTRFKEPNEPLLTYQKTIDINQRIIRDYPDVPFRDKVLYRAGVCLFETGKRDSAKAYFMELLSQYPDSAYIPEVSFRLAECYFDEQAFDKALLIYNRILEQWDSPFFSMALYKKAWSYYLMNDYPQAISSFYYLLSDIQLLNALDTELLGKSQAELTDEAIEYLATSFIDYGGVNLGIRFMKSMGESKYIPNIIHKMANVQADRDFWEDAISTYNKTLKLYPMYENAPQVQFEIFLCLDKLGNMVKAVDVRNMIKKLYGPHSEWAKQHPGKEKLVMVADYIQQIDMKIATPLLNTADSLFNAQNFEQSLLSYKNFIRTFPKDDRADHAAFYLAESYYQLKDYESAAVSYMFTAKNYTKSDLREDAAYNRIVSYDIIQNESNDTKADTLLWSQGDMYYVIPVTNKHQKKAIQAIRDFVEWFPQSEKSVELRLKLAETFIGADQEQLAEKHLNSILATIVKYNVGQKYYATALNMKATTNFKQNKFRDAQKWYAVLMKEYPDSTELIEKTKTMLATASYKVAETLKDDGNASRAAIEFEKTARNAVDDEIAEAALFESATQYQKAGQQQRAASNFELFAKRFPNSESLEPALFNAATLREQLTQWFLAAKNYADLARVTQDRDKAASAIYNSGLCYENAKAWATVIQTFNDFMYQFPNDDRYFECLFKVASAYEQSGSSMQAINAYARVEQTYQQFMNEGKYADEYLVAQSLYRLGDIRHKEFTAIKLEPPFQINLKKKQSAFNRMLEQFVSVAKYNVADWTTASFFTIGFAYEEFCKDIMNSPAPEGLTEEDLKSYWDMIEKQWVLPLQAEAVKYYQTNETLAVENNLENDWVKKTRVRHMYLNEKLAEHGLGTQIVKQAATTPAKNTNATTQRDL